MATNDRRSHPRVGSPTRPPRWRGNVVATGVLVLAGWTGFIAADSLVPAPVAAGTGIRMLGSSAIDESLPHSHDELDATSLTPVEQDALAERAERLGIGRRPRTQWYTSLGVRAQVPAPAQVGTWEGPYEWPVLGVHASLMPNGKVLAYDASINDAQNPTAPDQTFTRAMLFDPTTKAITRVDETLGFNIFCSGLAKLASGLLLTVGGNLNAANDGIRKSTTFDAATNRWTAGPDMAQARWYPAATPLPNGEMLVTGGGPQLSEVRQADGTFRSLTSAQSQIWANRDYPWLLSAPNGKVAFIGPADQIGYVDTAGSGAYQVVAARDGKTRGYGSFANFAPGKVLVTGGGNFDNSAVIVDLSTGSTTATQPMAFQRRQHNLTVLADGSVLATGGFGNSNEILIDLPNAVYNAELFNPATGTWRTLAAQQRARQYHSTAMLLPDGRVLSAGGGLCGPCETVGYLQRNAEIFTPPYLYAPDGSLAPRPQITAVSGQFGYGSGYPVSITTSSPIAKASLIRMSSVTHSVDMEQRYLPLSFTTTPSGITVTAPATANDAPPGWYLLFAVDTKGVPSVGAAVQVGNFAAPPTTTTIVPPTTTTNAPTTTTNAPTTTTVAPAPGPAAIVFDDSLRNGWANWSWAVNNLAAPGGLSGTAMSFEPDAWRGLYLHTDATTTPATGVEFWLNGRTGGQSMRILVSQNGTTIAERFVTAGSTWQKYTLAFSAAVASGSSLDFLVQDWSGADQLPVLVDNVALLGSAAPPPVTTTVPPPTTLPPTTTTTRQPTTTTTTTTSTTTTTVAPTTVAPTTRPPATTVPPPTTVSPSSTPLRTLFADAFVDATDWSWAPRNPASTSPVKVGSRALSVTATPWTGISFNIVNPLTVTGPTRLEFWIHGGPTGGQTITIGLFDGQTSRGSIPVSALLGRPIPANTWSFVSLDLSALGVTSGRLTRIELWHATSDNGGTYSLDDVRLVR